MTTRSGFDPQFPRVAGVAVALFSLRGGDDTGSGQILDLVPFIDWLTHWHQRVVQLLPINETAPGEASPYNTLSTFAIDPAYITVTRVIDVRHSAAAQQWLASRRVQQQMRRLRRSPVRRRKAVYTLNLRLLELGFGEFEARASSARTAAFEHFSQRNSWWLDDYALFRALKERRGWTSWETWPDALRRRDPRTLQRASATLRPRTRFFQYVQWIAADQWAQARKHARERGVLVKGDLPFVCGRDSADVWAHPELFDLSSSAGAPPDAFSPTGQAWGLPLYDWTAMRRAGYAWWRQRARQARELYDLFRVDHVVGLYRTYAIPVRAGGTSGFVPASEDEQRIQGYELMSALREEAGTACGVIAEDLGTVPRWVRESLTQLGIPGYKVFRWERHDGDFIDPRSYPALSVATTGTHDTESLAEWWETLSDDLRVGTLRSLDLEHGEARQIQCAPQRTADLHLALLRRLYEAGSALTIIPIQDLLGWRERINVPATTDAQNWTYRLPVTIDDLDQTPAIRERMEVVSTMIDQSGRNPELTARMMG